MIFWTGNPGKTGKHLIKPQIRFGIQIALLSFVFCCRKLLGSWKVLAQSLII